MVKWIVGILGTVLAGLLLAWATNILHLDGKDNGGSKPFAEAPPAQPPVDNGGTTKKEPGPVVMGALELGINRQGDDFDAFGKPAANAQLCAEMCRVDAKCDSMTYVKSTGLCWLKSGVPNATGDADMISAVKQKDNSAAM